MNNIGLATEWRAILGRSDYLYNQSDAAQPRGYIEVKLPRSRKLKVSREIVQRG